MKISWLFFAFVYFSKSILRESLVLQNRGTVSTEGKFFNTDRTTVGLWQATLHSFASEACLEQLQCSALLHSEIITPKRLIS